MTKLLDILNLLSMLILVSTFILISNKRINSYIMTFRVQSLLLAAVAAFLGIYHTVTDKSFDPVLIICVITIALKVVYIPNKLSRLSKQVEYKVEKDFFINIPLSIIICCGIVILTWYVVSLVPQMNSEYRRVFLTNSISVVLIGLFFMISRKKAIGQIIGFLVIENGMFLSAILITVGMPMIVELGIFFDLLTAVLIMGMFVFRINQNFDSIDINKMKNLKG
ncbi:MAG TPA: hydrogenase [Clostridia bacterium]|nr:hydrogenase [Clostridia bacterium]